MFLNRFLTLSGHFASLVTKFRSEAAKPIYHLLFLAAAFKNIFFLDNFAIIKEAIWNTPVPKYKILGRENLKTQVARAYLPDYFKNYKLYIWLDADMWLNDVKSFYLYEKGALNNKLTIVPQSDRSYVKNANVEWFFGFPKKIKTIN